MPGLDSKHIIERTKRFELKSRHDLLSFFNRDSIKDLTKFTISNYIRKAVTLAYESALTDD